MSEGSLNRPVGMLGLGIMGAEIARNLLVDGVAVVGFDPDQTRRNEAQDFGVETKDNCARVTEQCDFVLLSLPDSTALNQSVSEIVARTELHHSDRILVELSTLDLETKLLNRDRLADVGITLLDCPVSGTGAQAVNGDIAIYASGDEAAFERCEAILNRFARSVYFLGQFGQGIKMKLVANLLVAIHNVATAEAMTFGTSCGLDPDVLCKVIAAGAGSSRIFELRSPMMADGIYEPPTMKLNVWQKDMELIAKFAEEVGAPTPLFSATAPLYATALKNGLGEKDSAAVYSALQDMVGEQAAVGCKKAVNYND